MSQNGQTHFKSLAANAARFLKCVWLFWNIIYYRVKDLVNANISAMSFWIFTKIISRNDIALFWIVFDM